MTNESEGDDVEVHLDCRGQAVHVVPARGGSLLSRSVTRHGSVDDPATWVATLEALADEPGFAQLNSQDARLSIRSLQVGMVCLDNAGLVVYPVLWADDARSHDDATWCRKKFDDIWWESEVGLVPKARHLVTKLSWLHRSEADVWSRIDRVCSLEDFVVGRLIGNDPRAPVVSQPQVVAEFGVWSPRSKTYSTAVLSLIDDQRDWTRVFPVVHMVPAEIGSWRDWRISR